VRVLVRVCAVASTVCGRRLEGAAAAHHRDRRVATRAGPTAVEVLRSGTSAREVPSKWHLGASLDPPQGAASRGVAP
jgi:hypothetical protein